jgi:hypothetical protein
MSVLTYVRFLLSLIQLMEDEGDCSGEGQGRFCIINVRRTLLFSRVPENNLSGWSQTAEDFYVGYNSINKQN